MLELRARLAEVADLRNAKQLLDWDHQTMMPPAGSPTRAEALGTLERITHELFISEETGRLIERAAQLKGAIQSLPEEQGTLLKLAFYEGKSHSVIAEESRLPLGTVKSRLRLALARLRNSLATEI